MNVHNMTQKNLFESYIGPSPVLARYYSSKATSFATRFPGNSFYSVDRYLGNMKHFNKKSHVFGRNGDLKMPPLEAKSSANVSDPLVQIVGGFVGSKSQAGTSNHRGREFSLWDVIVDKLIEVMDSPETRQQGNPRKAGEANGKRRCHRMESFAVIGLGRFGLDCEPGTNGNSFRKDWYPPPGPPHPEVGIFQTNCSIEVTKHAEPQPASSGKSGVVENFCKNGGLNRETDKIDVVYSELLLDRPIEELVGDRGCPRALSDLESPYTSSSGCKFTEPPAASQLENAEPSPPDLIFSDVVLKSSLRPEAAEFSPLSASHPPTILETESEDDATPSDVLSSSCESQPPTFLPPRVQRTLSECSVDSDDSFIVFESAEDDTVILSEDSDDDDDDSCSDEGLDEIDNVILLPHNAECSQPPPSVSRLDEANKKWAESYSNAQPRACDSASKKVKFAEGKDLVRVKRLVAWDFAHRAARVGPWEMYHRDSERFKSRINALSAILSPVLAKRHRETIYAERFQT